MLRLRGTALGGGVALGTAALMRTARSIPVAPARVAAEQARREVELGEVPLELVDVVLATADYAASLRMNLPWARVVGIVAQDRADGAEMPPAGVAAVAGVADLLANVTDDVLLLVDGDRGLVLIDPDGPALAAYQAQRERMSPRRRVHIDFAHQPARSLDGREVRVLAQATTLDKVVAAVGSGADALYVPPGSPLLPADAEDEEQYQALLGLADAAAGKAITVAGDAESVSAAALLRAACRADLTLAAPANFGQDGFDDLRALLKEAGDELTGEDVDYATVRLAARIEAGSDEPTSLAALGVSRFIVSADAEITADAAEQLAELARAATSLLAPLEVEMVSLPESDLEAAVGHLLGLGAAGLIVPPDLVQPAKVAIRGLDVGEWRDAVWRRFEAAGYQ